MDSNVQERIVFDQPKSFAERQAAAKVLVERLGYSLPLAIDPIEAPAETAFAAWPERLYIVERGGRIAYKGEMGPFGFHPEEAEAALAKLLGVPRGPV